MKKILLYIFLTSFLVLFSFSLTNAEDILWKDLGLDLYKSVDEWFADLVDMQLEYELSGQWKWSIKDTVNSILQNDWDDIECDIESVDDILTMADKYADNQLELILEKCTKDWEYISMEYAATILRKMTSIKMNFTTRAREKSKYLYELSKIWLYSDWNDSNSPFDLMSDIRDIDAVISNNEIEYEEEWTWEYLEDGWPCDDYFCINLTYEEWQYGLKTWWWGWWWVEWINEILTRVVNHFRRFANTPSFVQTKMTANNFEISSIITNLSEMFRWFSIEVINEPVPIFESTKDVKKEDKSHTSPEKRLVKYFKNINLDYYRSNDLWAIRWDIEEKRQIQKSIGRPPSTVTEDPKEPIVEGSQKNIGFDDKNIDRETMIEDLNDFYNQFSEIQRFGSSINNFVQDTCYTINEILKIPISNN